ncbi:serine hydrolase [Aeromicrobium sp. Leaf350]|uniref:serine hydrolase domain-containing protein n=1 Tax=Aeromicrobium sp. Leaf350 TaxID=2876565 RepID=UPI001E55BAEE|nr:serine hydrolase domain-containing protein [Aeromicrobium sp. Leaf350]
MTDLEPRVRTALTQLIDDGDLPGATWALVVGRGEQRTVHVESAGTCSDDTIFRIASLTKPVVGVLTRILVEEGVLGLADPVTRWVPELEGRQVLRSPGAELDDVVPPARDLTVADVLEMGAGLGWSPVLEGTPLQRAQVETELESTWQPSPLEPDEWVRRLRDVPMAHQPGEGWLYQMSFDLLPVVLERAAGAGLDEILAERLLEPLNMADTGWQVGPDQLGRVPAQFFPDGSGGHVEVSPEADPSLAERPAFRSAATGLLSTAADLAAFVSLLLEDGAGPRGPVVPAAVLHHLAGDRLGHEARVMAQADLGPKLGWGHGVAVDLEPAYPGSHVGRFGWHGGTGTSMWVDPTAGLGAVLLTQHGLGDPNGADYLDTFWSAVHAV